MYKKLSLWLLWLATYAGFLLLTLPAIQAYRLLPAAQASTIKVGSLSGTVWNALAKEVQVGELRFRQAELSPNLLPLLTGKFTFNIKVSGRDLKAQTTLHPEPEGRWHLTNLQATLDAAQLAGWLKLTARFSGEIRLSLEELRVHAQGIQDVRGKVIWDQAVIDSPLPIKLGKLQCDFRTQNKQLVGTVKNSGEEISLRGKLTLGVGGDYQLDLTLKPRTDALRQQLATSTPWIRPQRGGEYLFQFQGRL